MYQCLWLCTFYKLNNLKYSFSTGSNYYVYNGLIRESGPTPITNIDPSLPSNIDAVVTWAADKKTYIFKDELVWRYDELTRSVDPDWPYRIDEVWRGVPNGVAAAFHNEDSRKYFFKEKRKKSSHCSVANNVTQFKKSAGYVRNKTTNESLQNKLNLLNKFEVEFGQNICLLD